MAQSDGPERANGPGASRAGSPAESGDGRSASDSVTQLASVVIRFAGDSGDGMQLTGAEFTRAAAVSGNDIATFPDFPAEIRAPSGTLYGVSGFQLQFSSSEIFTAGDAPDVLVAMNPAALKTNIAELEPGGMIIVDSGSFKRKFLGLAGYEANPLEDGTLSGYRLIPVDMSRAVSVALKDSGLSPKDVLRTRNFYALGLLFWLYGRETAPELESIRQKFTSRPELADVNARAFELGYAYGETIELFDSTYRVPAAPLAHGRYRNITGNEATALGLVAASLLSDRRVIYASYPITPASAILESLARHRSYPVTAFQAEDEIAAVTAAIGASFAGAIGVTGTSGPGFALKQEGIGLAVMTELPLVVIDVQRAGPSTGMPTKPEQSDLLQAVYGRNGESPVAVLAPATPKECFQFALEAVRLAVQHMCPVILLSDGSIANGSEPWRLPRVEDLERIDPGRPLAPGPFEPYARDPETLVRPWAVAGEPGLEHRIGGLEKADGSGDISYDPENHAHMTQVRSLKVDRIADRLPPARLFGPSSGELLVIGFGGTFGALRQATHILQQEGHTVSHLQLRYLNPFQRNVGELLRGFRMVLVAELNSGQLRMMLRSRFLIDALGLNRVEGRPLRVRDVLYEARTLLNTENREELRV